MDSYLNKGESASNKRITLQMSFKDFLISLICFILSGAGVLGVMNPFGIAFYAASFSPSGWYYSLIASILGIISAKGDFTAVRYILALGLATPIIGISDKRKPMFKAIVMSISYLSVCTFLMLSNGFLMYDYIYVAFESFICFTSIYIMGDVIDVIVNYKKIKAFSKSESAAVVSTICLLIVASSNVPDIFGLGLCSALGIFFILCVSVKKGGSGAITAGVIIGTAIMAARQQTVSVVGAYAFCAFMASLLNKYSRLGTVLGFTLGNAIITAFFNDTFYLLINPVEVLVSGLVFATLPKKTFSFFDGLSDKLINTVNKQTSDVYRKNYIKTHELSKSLSFLSDVYMRNSQKKILGKRYMTGLFNVCAERACSDCGKKFLCWKSATYRNYEYMAKMFEYAEKKGGLDVKGLPKEFSKCCVKKEEFVKCFNFCHDIYMLDKMWLTKTYRIKKLMAHQLKAISVSLDNDVSQNKTNFNFKSYGVQNSKQGFDVCGDSVKEINLSNGDYAFVLCDGMGSGKEANSESEDTALMLESMLKIGLSVSKAVELANLSLIVKSEKECFSTVDILYADMEKGKITLSKSGTAPTYIYQDKQVKKYECKCLPVGILTDIETQSYSFDITGRTVVVMVSDGITNVLSDNGKEGDAVSDVIENLYIYSPEEISKAIMEEAVNLNGGNVTDDMTVHTVIFEQK